MLVVSITVNAWFAAPTWFNHAPWVGVHPVDLVFPTFVTLSGVGLGILYSRGVRVAREVRRALVLFAAGLAYNAVTQYLVTGGLDLSTFRLTGVLQLYAVVVLVVALLSLVATSWWRWLVAAVALAVLQTGILLAAQSACAGGLTPECNPSRTLDLVRLGGHAYAGGRLGHDPEGVIAILGALVSASIGAAAGRVLRERARVGSAQRVRATAVILATCVVGVVVTGGLVPTFKRLWTSPFTFTVAGGVVLVLVVLHLLLHTRAPGRAEGIARYPLVALGRNSLLVYFGSHLVMETLVLRGPDGTSVGAAPSWAESWQTQLADAVAMPGSPWPFCVAAVVAWTALAVLLHRLRIYVKA